MVSNVANATQTKCYPMLMVILNSFLIFFMINRRRSELLLAVAVNAPNMDRFTQAQN